jgi:hypothetical protein
MLFGFGRFKGDIWMGASYPETPERAMFIVDSKGNCRQVPDRLARFLEPHYLAWQSSAHAGEKAIPSDAFCSGVFSKWSKSGFNWRRVGAGVPDADEFVSSIKTQHLGWESPATPRTDTAPSAKTSTPGRASWLPPLLVGLIVLVGLYLLFAFATSEDHGGPQPNRQHHSHVVHIPVHGHVDAPTPAVKPRAPYSPRIKHVPSSSFWPKMIRFRIR